MQLFKLNNTYTVSCVAENTRSGFRHVSTLFKYGYEVESAKCCYLNRTWESFPFQTVLRKLIESSETLTEKEKKRFSKKLDLHL